MKLKPRARSFSHVLPWWGRQLAPLFLFVLALGLFFYSSVNPAAMEGAKARSSDIVAPILMTVNMPVQAAANYIRGVTGLAALQAENVRLAQENARLREWYQAALLLQQENDRLQKMLNVPQGPSKNYITARVVADSGHAYAKSLLIMAGASNGVEKGQAVMTPNGLLGRIVENGQSSARVLLLNDMNSRVPVLVQGLEVKAIMAGSNGLMPRLEHVAPGAELTEGLPVITSGHGGVLPYGLPVGVLSKDKQGRWGVKLSASANNATLVRVIDNGNSAKQSL